MTTASHTEFLTGPRLETPPTKTWKQRLHSSAQRPRRAARGRKPPGAGCSSPEAERASEPTHDPNLEPSSASTDDHNALDRGDPAPITIEAGISSSPASRETTPHGQEDLGPKPDATHLTTSPRRPAPRTAAAFKAHFWLLFLQPKKVTRPQARSAGRNAVDLEVEVCFMCSQVIGIQVEGPIKTNHAPVEDFVES